MTLLTSVYIYYILNKYRTEKYKNKNNTMGKDIYTVKEGWLYKRGNTFLIILN